MSDAGKKPDALCWFCGRRPADPACAWTTTLAWTRPKTLPPPVDYDDTMIATANIKRLNILLPRCEVCRDRARRPALLNAIGISAGGGICLFLVALWALLSSGGLPRIQGTWYPVAAVATVAGAMAGGFTARLWHPKRTRRLWSEHPSVRVLAAEGWTKAPRR